MVNVVNELLRDRWTLGQTLEMLEALRAPMQVISWLNGRRSLTDCKEFMLLFSPTPLCEILLHYSLEHFPLEHLFSLILSFFSAPRPTLFSTLFPISILKNTIIVSFMTTRAIGTSSGICIFVQ